MCWRITMISSSESNSIRNLNSYRPAQPGRWRNHNLPDSRQIFASPDSVISLKIRTFESNVADYDSSVSLVGPSPEPLQWWWFALCEKKGWRTQLSGLTASFIIRGSNPRSGNHYFFSAKRTDRLWGLLIVYFRFSTPVQTGPGVHPASSTMGTVSFQEIKWPGLALTTHPYLAPRIK